MNSHRILALVGGFALACAALGCSGEPTKPGPASVAAAEIQSFAATPDAIAAGASATLRWQTRNAARIEIVAAGGAPIAIGDEAPTEGSVTVAPKASTSYELRAFNGSGAMTSAVTGVQLLAAPAIVSFTAAPADVAHSGEVTLAWQLTDAETVEIRDAANRKVDLAGAAAAQGSVTFAATQSTIYTLTARGPGGEATASAEVRVHGTPRITFDTPGVPILPGTVATLEFSATDATSVTITDEAGNVLYEGAELAGRVTVQPDFTTRYLAIAKGIGGEASVAEMVQVQPVIDAFAAEGGPVHVGEEIALTFAIRGARTAELRTGVGAWLTLSPEMMAEGTATMIVELGGAFTLEARSGGLVASATTRVDIDPTPFIRSVDATPALVSASAQTPADVTVSWLVDRSWTVAVEAIPGGPVALPPDVLARADSVTTSVTSDTIFRVTATNEFGSSQKDVQVLAFPAPTIERLAVYPSVARIGDPVQVQWNTRDADRVALGKDGLDLGIAPTLIDGSFDDVVLGDATYELRSWNPAGFEVSSSVSVTIGTPEILSFTGSDTFMHTGQPFTFSWVNAGGHALTITDDSGNTVCDVAEVAKVAEGSCTILGPSTGSHVYTLSLQDHTGAELDSSTLGLAATDGPVIRSFTAAPPLVSVDDPIDLSWEITTDAAGNAASLVVSDGQGHSWNVGSPAPISGSARIAIATAGTYDLTLTASTPGTTAASVELSVEVRNRPTIDSFAATPEVVSMPQPATTTLSWVTHHGFGLSVVELDEDGLPTGVPLYTALPNEVATGQHVQTLADGPHQLAIIVDNGAGATAQATVGVQVNPAEVLTFNATPPDVLAGTTTTLGWTTQNATGVMIGGLPITATQKASAEEISATYVDVSSLPGASQLFPTDVLNGFVQVTFPAGFTFPWDGADRTTARIGVNGVVSFNTTVVTGTLPDGNVAFPYHYYAQKPHLAPFWSHLLLSHTLAPSMNGEMWWASGSDDLGDYLIFQWKGVGYWDADQGYLGGELNFNLVLRANGAWETRFGDMISPAGKPIADGEDATIGYQNEAQSVGENFSYNQAVPGGLAGRAWRFEDFSLPANGTVQAKPTGSTTFVLTARNDYSLDQATAQVRHHKAVVLANPTIAPAERTTGQPFSIGWTTQNAASVEVLDGNGNVIHTAPAASRASGSYLHTETVEGNYTYSVRATGTLSTDVQTKQLGTYVYRPFSIDAFTADSVLINPGQSVRISWQTVGAASATLFADGMPVSLAGKSIAQDFIDFTPALSTRYTFNIVDAPASAPFRVRTRELLVQVRTGSMDTFSPLSAQVAPGGSVNLTWTSTGASHVTIPGAANVSTGGAFVDVSLTGTALTRSGTVGAGTYSLNMAAQAFSFPWDGADRTEVKLSVDGVLSFDSAASFTGANTTMPNASQPKFALAPFWDDLNAGTVYWQLFSPAGAPRYLVLQWKDFSIVGVTGSLLSFEVVLFEDGTWEYRYGPITAGSSAARVNGSDATIAWQEQNGLYGTAISFNTQVTPDLSGRSWRFDKKFDADSASTSFTPSAGTGTYRVCAVAPGYKECRDLVVTVVQPGDMMITELMANPAGPNGNPDGEWFEVRNTAPYAIDLNGWSIASTSTSASHTIANGGPLVVQPGQYLVLARASLVGVTAGTYVYGTSITLDELVSTGIRLLYGGVEMDRVTWDSSWFSTSGTARELDPSYDLRDATKNDVAANFCQATAVYAGANLGTPGATGDGCRFTSVTVDAASPMPFIDIASSGTPLTTLIADEAIGALGLPFSFDFLGSSYSTAYVSSNGFVSFDPLSQPSSSNTTLPAIAAPRQLIAGFWDNLIANTGSNLQYQTVTVGTQQVLVIQWSGWRVGTSVVAGSMTFQLQLWDNGDIVSAIKESASADPSNANVVGFYKGSSATFGLQGDGTAGSGVLVSLNAPVIFPGKAIHYRKR